MLQPHMIAVKLGRMVALSLPAGMGLCGNGLQPCNQSAVAGEEEARDWGHRGLLVHDTGYGIRTDLGAYKNRDRRAILSSARNSATPGTSAQVHRRIDKWTFRLPCACHARVLKKDKHEGLSFAVES